MPANNLMEDHMKHTLKSKNTLKSISCSMLLLASMALTTQNAGAQTPPTAGPMWEGWQDPNAAPTRDANLLRDDALVRQSTERYRKLSEVLDQDKNALEQPRQLLARLFELPATLKLSAENHALAEATLQAQRTRATAAWADWQEQAITRVTQISNKPAAQIEEAGLQLSMRAINEAALWFGDTQAHASDALWIEALKRPGLCDGLSSTEPGAQIATLIEALPPESRAAAWAGEAARLARWGQEARKLLPPPERSLEDSLVPALTPPALAKTLLNMPVALRSAAQTPGWKLATQAPAQRCEILRWWSQEQVRSKQLTPRQAMLAWRSALAPRSVDFLLTTQPRNGAVALDKNGFPLVAHSMALVGRVFVEQDIDANGKVLSAFIQRRELHAASLGKQDPVGLEHELDLATLDRVAAMAPKAPDPATLRDGVATRRVGIEWAIN
jgi:hypothetical protein